MPMEMERLRHFVGYNNIYGMEGKANLERLKHFVGYNNIYGMEGFG